MDMEALQLKKLKKCAVFFVAVYAVFYVVAVLSLLGSFGKVTNLVEHIFNALTLGTIDFLKNNVWQYVLYGIGSAVSFVLAVVFFMFSVALLCSKQKVFRFLKKIYTKKMLIFFLIMYSLLLIIDIIFSVVNLPHFDSIFVAFIVCKVVTTSLLLFIYKIFHVNKQETIYEV